MRTLLTRDRPSAGSPDPTLTARRMRYPASATMMRTMMLAGGPEPEQATAAADVVLRPGPRRCQLEVHQIDAMREAGRVAARDAMPAISALVR